MEESEDEFIAWAKKTIGEKGMQILTDAAIKGIKFKLQFLKNPFEFCAIHQFKVYMGFGPDKSLDKTYIFVYQKDIDTFVVIWIYPDGDMPAYVVQKRAVQNFIKVFNFSFIDNEIFLLWLNESKDIIQPAYQEAKEKYEKILEYQNKQEP